MKGKNQPIDPQAGQPTGLTYMELLRDMEENILHPFRSLVSAPEPHCPDEIRQSVGSIHTYLFSRDLTVERLKESCGITGNHFSALFELHTGKTPQDYYLDLRIEAAKRILSDKSYKDLKIVSIALSVGFNSSEAFIQAFKKRIGMPPGKWRKRNI